MKKTALEIAGALCLLAVALLLMSGCGPTEDTLPYSLYWDGQLYRSYAEEWKEPVAEEAFVGETEALCPGNQLPDAHGEANCLQVGTVIARVDDKLLAQESGEWWIFFAVTDE